MDNYSKKCDPSLPKVAIVGLGKMGILHAGIVNALPSCEITAICENHAFMIRAAKKILKRVSFYRNVRDMIDKEEIDAIFITSPIHTHAPVVREIMRSSKRIGLFSEKPLAANSKDAHEIAEGISKCGVTNVVGFHKRFSPIIKHAKRLLDAGAIGQLQSFSCYSYSADVSGTGKGWRFRKGMGGALLDLGPHLLDLLLWYFGEPKRVSALEQSVYSKYVEDHVQANVTFRSGLNGTIDISWSQSGYRLPEIRLEIHGTKGSITVSDDYVSIQANAGISGVIEAGRHIFQKPEFNTNVDFLLAEPEYTIEDKAFIAAAQAGIQIEPSFHTAAKVNDFVDMIHQNAKIGSIS